MNGVDSRHLTPFPHPRIPISAFTCIEICTGAGGQAIGLERAGFEAPAHVEFDRHACETLRLNRPDWNVEEGDVRAVRRIFIWLPARAGWMVVAMNIQSIAGIVMIIAGGALLAYGGFTTTKRENIIDAGPIKIQADVKERHRVPPVISWALLGGGVVVLVLGARKK